MRLAWIFAVGFSLATVAGCYSPPKPACAFSCLKAERLCPKDYECGDDGLCHRTDAPATATCSLDPAIDAGAGD